VVAAPVTILVLHTRAGLTWVVLLAFALLALAVAAGRAALGRDPRPEKMQYDALPPRRPWVIIARAPAAGR
jgi:hypothetical protein